MPVLRRGLDNPREAAAPVVAATGDQPHPVAVALQAKAVAVILDLVELVGAVGDMSRRGIALRR
jgi:hypothetical protein